MRSKFEAWIPTLGREVDATKQAWKFDILLMRSKYEAWIPILDFFGSGCDEASVEVN